jgi:hypothetical protein
MQSPSSGPSKRWMAKRSHDKPFLLVASYLDVHNIREWTRRLPGANQS